MKIDLRSDTVTKPTATMREAMFEAEVGDDVLGEDPTVNKLEQMAAQLFGMEDALFCASGTQTNQIAIHVHTRPGDEVICSDLSHIYIYEGGGIALNSFCSVALIEGDRGRINAEQIASRINPDDVHRPISRLVSIEDTMNKGGGAIYDLEEIRKIRSLCTENNLSFHCDGARLFNALVAKHVNPSHYAMHFDSISICLSKGLGAPVGSLLLGNRAFIRSARRRRKSMGGGMRQAGFIAAAGIYALEHHITRLQEDHDRAKEIERVLLEQQWVKGVTPVESNIVIFDTPENKASEYVQKLKDRGVLCFPFGPSKIRFVTHLDFNDEHLNALIKVLRAIV